MKSIHSRYLAGLTMALLALSGPRAAHALTYSIDDGVAENSIGFGSAGSNAGAIFLNGFTVVPGFNSITSISIAWGFNGNTQINGLSMTALLYSDPNGDGDPIDGVLLSSIGGTIQSAGSNTFITYTLPSATTVLGNDFFVGFYLPGFIVGGAEQFPAAIDQTAPTFSGVSYLSANGDGTEPSTSNLGNNSLNGTIEGFGLAGNWLIRANAIPEPSTWAMIGIGAVGLVGLRFRRRTS